MRTDGWTWRPARSDVLLSLRWALLLAVLFFSVYGISNWIAAQRARTYRMWFDWELEIPFVPQMLWAYLSLNLLFFLPMFALRGPSLNALCRRLAFAVVASGCVFVLAPAQLGFERQPDAHGVLKTLYELDLPHNLVPSLHISWSALFLGALRGASPPAARRLFEVWFLVLCAAVLLVHQHHVLDIAGGLLVALAAKRVVRSDGNWAWQGTTGRQ